MDESDGRKRSQDKDAHFTPDRDDHRSGSFICRTWEEFFLVVPFVEAEPGLLRMRIVNMRGPHTGFYRGGLEKGGITNDLAGLAMAFKIVKGLDRKENPVHRQNKRVES
jgi:hypothetical protein